MIQILVAILATVGSLFALIASIGILRMPDFYSQLSITVKAATMGMGTILFSAAIFFNDFPITSKSMAIVFFLLITAPIAGHIISKAAYIIGIPLWERTQIDELHGKYDPKSGLLKIKKNKKTNSTNTNEKSAQ